MVREHIGVGNGIDTIITPVKALFEAQSAGKILFVMLSEYSNNSLNENFLVTTVVIANAGGKETQDISSE